MEIKDVFISYKSEEFHEADWVRSVLEKNGISCWMAPTSIPGGTSYATEIPRAIRTCKFFVLILSENAQTSKWVPRELDQAINDEKTVMPFMIENCLLRDDFNFYLTNVQRYEAYANREAAITKMIREMKAILGTEAGTVSSESFTAFSPVMEKTNTAKTRNWFSLLSVGLGILSLLSLGLLVIPEVFAIVFAILSAKELAKYNHQGKGLAIAGLVLSLLSMIIGCEVSEKILRATINT